MKRTFSHWRRAAGMVAATALVAACADLPLDTPGFDAPDPLQQRFDCQGDALGNISCAPASTKGASPTGLEGISFGGQGIYVFLQATNPQAEDGDNVVRGDVTVQNLTAQTMGSTDGDDATMSSPIRVVLHDISGASAFEWDGDAPITSDQPQPYMAYGAGEGVPLVTNEVSGARTWAFQLDTPGGSFTFSVYVNADVPQPESVFLWDEVYTDGTGDGLRGIWGLNENDIVAVGQTGAVVFWNGTGWTRADQGTVTHNAIHGTSQALWIASDGGNIYRYDGNQAAFVSEPVFEADGTEVATRNLLSIYVLDGVGAWAGGTFGTLYERRLDGDGLPFWIQVCTSCGGHNNFIQAIWASSAENVIGGMGAGNMFRYDAVAETHTTIANGTSAPIRAVWGVSDNTFYIAGDSRMMRVTTDGGTTWSDVPHGATGGTAATGRISAMWGTGPDDIWIAGAIVIGVRHWNGQNWIKSELHAQNNDYSNDLQGIMPLSLEHVLIVGNFQTSPHVFRGTRTPHPDQSF